MADVEAAMTVLRYKSAKYSIERPLHVGATLAGASEAQLREDCALPGGYAAGSFATGWTRILAALAAAAEPEGTA